jgi:hypothetical protein
MFHVERSTLATTRLGWSSNLMDRDRPPGQLESGGTSRRNPGRNGRTKRLPSTAPCDLTRREKYEGWSRFHFDVVTPLGSMCPKPSRLERDITNTVPRA